MPQTMNDGWGARARVRRHVLLPSIVWAIASSSCQRAPAATSEANRSTPTQQQALAAPATPASVAVGARASAEIRRVLPYPRGRWRLASMDELAQVVLWFSHILIRYDGVLESTVSFSALDWSSHSPPSMLSRDAALELARRIAQEAALGQTPFSDLAAAYSEDITTADRGGSLGGVTASDISLWPQILDALAVLQPGQTSEVIETPYGFHILKKHPPPPEQAVSGAHIVIGHDDAPFFRGVLMRDDTPHRSRTDAEALARDLYERARHRPATFSDLVGRYSEHQDAEVRGDLGQWSTREPLAPAREIEVLAQLAVGEVARPIDTPYGFQILMRTDNRERPEFAHQAVEVPFDPRATAGSFDSEAAARKRATDLAARVNGAPQVFDALRAELCCKETNRWREGRREPGLQAALSLLEIGEIATTPLRTVASYVILRRLEPTTLHPPAVSVQLPANPTPDIDALLGWLLDPRATTWVLRALSDAVDELDLPGERRAGLRELLTASSGLGTGDDRVRAVAAIDDGAKALLSTPEYQRYRRLATRLVERAVLEPRRGQSPPSTEALPKN